MIIDVMTDETMPGVSSAYRVEEDDNGFVLQIALKPHGLVRFHFERKTDIRAFVNRIVNAANR